jgi:hypothetical protein
MESVIPNGVLEVRNPSVSFALPSPQSRLVKTTLVYATFSA